MDRLFEGHVPQGVEVQVLSSALPTGSCWMLFRRPCNARRPLAVHGLYHVQLGAAP
jgi:hypothetical protein